jgi:protein disulfide-isomerase
MKKAFVLALVTVAAWRASADDLWLTDLPTAEAQAKAQGKIVLMDFTGSDWCPACIEFKKQVLDSEAFQAYASSNVVVVEVDFPDKKPQSEAVKKANAALLTKYGVDGYPTFVVVDPNGKEIGRQLGYDATGPQAFIAKVQGWKTAK